MIARNPLCPRCRERPKHGQQGWCRECGNAYQRERYAKRRAEAARKAKRKAARRAARQDAPPATPCAPTSRAKRTTAKTAAGAPRNRVAGALRRLGERATLPSTWRVMVADWGTGWRMVAEGDRVRCEAEYRERKLEHVFVRLYADGEVVATHRAGAKRARRRRKAKRT